MAHIKILHSKEIEEFDTPPLLTGEGRKCFFYVSNHAAQVIKSLQTPTNQLGFLLQLGYFKASNKFFSASKFHLSDIEYVQKKLNINSHEIALSNYTSTTFRRHQEIILKELGFKNFGKGAKKLFRLEALELCKKQIKPRTIFGALIEYLKWKRIEIPQYNTFAEIISISLRKSETRQLLLVENNLTVNTKKLLDGLLEKEDEDCKENESCLKIKRYKLTNLKKNSQSVKPLKIKENIDNLESFELLFNDIEPVVAKLRLSPELIQYYAQIVIKSRSFQTDRRKNRKYLYLMAFVFYQYYTLNDTLIEQVMKSVQNTLNTSQREHKENYYFNRKRHNQKIADSSEKVDSHLYVIRKARVILADKKISSDEKVIRLKEIFSFEFSKESKELQKQFKEIAQDSSNIAKSDDYYNLLEDKSLKLQNRASGAIKRIKFDATASDKNLIDAIEYYKQRNGKLVQTAPIEFLEIEKRKLLFDANGKLRTSLYKALLFKKVIEGIRSGGLSIQYSFKYRSFDDYLIPLKYWQENKESILKRTGLTESSDFNKLISELKKIMQQQFHETNKNINNGYNKYASVDSKRILKIRTPKKETGDHESIQNLFPQNRLISLFEVLSTVNDVSNFTQCFEHHQKKHNRKKPSNKIFFAGLIGYGCNLGSKKITKISNHINSNELENTINWYFSYDNLQQANDKVLELMEQLELPKVYVKNKGIVHTSSDGQKFRTAVESLNANYSFKYCGKNQGVSIYGFIDESHRLFHSTVINPTEREAAYVIDGLMQNNVIKSDIHSTDTHGYSEIIFAITHLLGVSFAPRIKNMKTQQLYSFDKPSDLKNMNYNIISKHIIKPEIIDKEWDNILRFIATIKLKEATVSQLLRRLSSYAKNHPLYRSLKTFGRIIKTIFLLKYIDDVELRQMIEKQLNKMESSNKFSKAVFHGNNHEFQLPAPEEQLVAVACKRLIENSIICWNYLYLSKCLHDIKCQQEKENIINDIMKGSIVIWQHINMQGEYDFSDDYLKNSIKFSLPELLDVLVA